LSHKRQLGNGNRREQEGRKGGGGISTCLAAARYRFPALKVAFEMLNDLPGEIDIDVGPVEMFRCGALLLADTLVYCDTPSGTFSGSLSG